VKRRGVDYPPNEKIGARVVVVLIGIEDVVAGKLAGGDDQPVGGLRPGKLIGPILDLFGFATKVDRLT
jgi:hypothetical protein